MTEKYTSNDHQIQDPTLAEHVAYAEKTEIEAGLLAVAEGRFNSVAGHFSEADKLGKVAGTAYLNDREEQIASDRKILGSSETDPNNELEQKVEVAKLSLAERYNLAPEDFMHVSYEDDEGNTKNVVVLATKEGLDLGDPSKDYDKKRSYREIMAKTKKNNQAHTIVIDGVAYDDRTGMTFDAYEVLAQEKDFEIDRRKWTLMTGEQLTADGDVRIASVYGDGSVDRNITRVGNAYRNLGFRPAVVV